MLAATWDRPCSHSLLEARSRRGVKVPRSVLRDPHRASVCRPVTWLPSSPCFEASPPMAVCSVRRCLARHDRVRGLSSLSATVLGDLVPRPARRRCLLGGEQTAVHMMRREAFSAAVLVLITGAPLAWAGNPVSVPAKYDGRWTIEAITVSRACPGTLSLAMDVAKGEATVSSSILYSVTGGISQAGAVRGTISTAATTALVTGKVEGDDVGRGTWRTQDGSLLTCNGSWTAHRV